MTTIDVKNTSGKKAGSAELAASVFEIEPNMHAMHEVVRSQRAARRAGTHNTLTRGQVRGGGKKPWRHDFIDNKALVVTSAVLDRIEEVLA